MDLIAEIIKRKNATPTDALDIIKQLLTDIITYEKLAQNKRFQDIQNPVVAKRCPNLHKATTEIGYESALLRELLPVLISFTNRSYTTLELEERTKREEILDASYSIHLTVQDGGRYTEDDENQLVLRELNIEDPALRNWYATSMTVSFQTTSLTKQIVNCKSPRLHTAMNSP